MGEKTPSLLVTATTDISNGGHYYRRIVNNTTGKTKVKETIEPVTGVRTVKLTQTKLEYSDGHTKTTTTAGPSGYITRKAPAEYDTSEL